jgi:hypothetical protein
MHRYYVVQKGIVLQLTGKVTPIEGKTVLGDAQMFAEINSK